MVGDSWGSDVTLVLVITAAMALVRDRMVTLPLLMRRNIRRTVGVSSPGI